MSKPTINYCDLLRLRLALAEYILKHKGDEDPGERRDMESLLNHLGTLVDRVWKKRKTTITVNYE